MLELFFQMSGRRRSMGDYIIGPSHVLPTNGMAKRQSGLSVFNFLRRQSTISSPKKQ